MSLKQVEVIAGPTLANIEALPHVELVRHAKSLEDYGWRMFEQLRRTLDNAHQVTALLNKLTTAHQDGDQAEIARLLDECLEARQRWLAKHAARDARFAPGGRA